MIFGTLVKVSLAFYGLCVGEVLKENTNPFNSNKLVSYTIRLECKKGSGETENTVEDFSPDVVSQISLAEYLRFKKAVR